MAPFPTATVNVRGIGDPRPPVEVRIEPLAGGSYTVEIPEFAGQTVDLLTGVGELHSVLDGSGRAEIHAARVRWVRPAGGEWMATAHP